MTREEAIKVIKSATVYTPEEMKALEILIPELRKSEDERIRKEIICFIEYEEARGNIPDKWYQAKRPGIWISYLEKQKEGKEELSESENERIRKVIVKSIEEDSSVYEQEVSKESMLAWLKKQKEQKSRIDACGFPLRDEEESACSYLERCLSPDMRNIWYEACSEIKEKQKEQKPADYTAELKKCKDNPLYFYDKYVSIKQKPAEWSEEDEDMLNSCISSIEEAKENRYAYKETDGDTSYDHEIEWLKSLRPSWKPSEEQMKALAWYSGNSAIPPTGDKAIQSLYNDLKKLM